MSIVTLWQNSVCDHQFHIQTGRQSRPKTPQNLRTCKKCPDYVEDEAHFLLQCKEDSDIKKELVQRIAMDFPKVSEISDKNILYKFVMKIQTPEILKSIGFCINLLFKNRENRRKEDKSL